MEQKDDANTIICFGLYFDFNNPTQSPCRSRSDAHRPMGTTV